MEGFGRDTIERLLRGGLGSALVHTALALLLFIPVPAPDTNNSSRPSSLLIVRATAAETDLAPHPAPDSPFRNQSPNHGGEALPLSINSGPNGADFTIDLARIRDRRSDLFPFVTWDLGFLRRRPWERRDVAMQFATSGDTSQAPPGASLALSPAQIQAIVDRAFSRRNRWSNLQELVRLTERYSGDRGDLAAVFSAYAQQNVPQPYEDWSDPDPVYWIMLTLAADDAPLVEFVARYLRRYPTNRVSTELLFLLDASAESSCDVLSRVLHAGTPELPLAVTQVDNPDAFELAVSLAAAYRGWIFRHRADVTARCVESRVAILRRIIDTSPAGYGVSDARFRLGQTLWTADRRAEAVDWWRGMAEDGRNETAQVQKRLLGAIAEDAPASNPSRITGILRDEENHWRDRSGARLDAFGIRPTEF